MREIKYKVWDGKNVSVGLAIAEISLTWPAEAIGRLTFLQFTGLKDKNGKEIYEDDVVILHPALDSDIRREQGKRYRVEYIAPRGMLSYEDGSFSEGGNGWWENQVEVIANIYEHPDLVNV